MPRPELERVSVTVRRAAYEACQRAGSLRNGRPYRVGFAHPNKRRAANTKACRGKVRPDEDR